MQETKKYIVFRNKETGKFLKSFKSKGTLAFETPFTNEIEAASITIMDAFETQTERFKALAKATDCEVVVVEATFNLKYLNGKDVEKVEVAATEDVSEAIKTVIKAYMASKGGN